MRSRDEVPLSGVGLVLCSIVEERPGIHFRGLARAASLTSAGQLRHHLDRLKRHGRVVEVQDGRYKRFFLAGHHDPNLRPGMARFSRPVPRQIGKLLLNRPMNRTELRRSLGCADSTLGYHLKRMVELGDLQKERGRNCCKYILRDGELVRKVLSMQEEAPSDHPVPRDTSPRFRESRSPRRWSPQGIAAGAPAETDGVHAMTSPAHAPRPDAISVAAVAMGSYAPAPQAMAQPGAAAPAEPMPVAPAPAPTPLLVQVAAREPATGA